VLRILAGVGGIIAVLSGAAASAGFKRGVQPRRGPRPRIARAKPHHARSARLVEGGYSAVRSGRMMAALLRARFETHV
jgi:hypothetical protein